MMHSGEDEGKDLEIEKKVLNMKKMRKRTGIWNEKYIIP